jgi:nucleotide-binding universal stress UspA family protein
VVRFCRLEPTAAGPPFAPVPELPSAPGITHALNSGVLTLRHLLVPIDFTETSERALEYAVELARKFEATITVMHAYQIPVYGFPDGAYITGANLAAQISDAAQKRLDSVLASQKVSGIPMSGVLRDGVPWEEINAVAAEVHADLIIIGTHGRRGLARALLGSIAENVIRTSTLPVMVIHGPRDTA